MIKNKQAIIRMAGIPVNVISPDGTEVTTTALVGRASKQFNMTVSLETHRRAHVLPEVFIDSGYVVFNTANGESYLVVATYDDYLYRDKSDTVVMMFKCNGTILVEREKETADDNGKITKVNEEVYSNIKAYIQPVNMDLKQFDPGLYPTTEFVIYCPKVTLDLLDKITVNVEGHNSVFKIVANDYISYPGLVRIQVRSETRRE